MFVLISPCGKQGNGSVFTVLETHCSSCRNEAKSQLCLATIKASATCSLSAPRSSQQVRCVLLSKLLSKRVSLQHSCQRQGFCYRGRCQAFLRGLLGAIPVTSSGVNLLEDSYQLHVMFAFSLQFRQLPHCHLNTLLGSTLEGHFYLKR